MELTGAAIRRSLPWASPAAERGRGRGTRRQARVSCVGRGGGGFADEGHLRYYGSPPRKAVEAAARDLPKLRAMGLVAGDAAKERILSEATELLQQELDHMKDEEDEMKKRKEEKKAAMKALKQQQKEAKKAAAALMCEDNSSESSESECEEEGQFMKMSCAATISSPGIEQGMAISTAMHQIAASDVATVLGMECEKASMKAMKKREKEQKKAAKKAMKMKKEEQKMAMLNCYKDEDSSSCSSESSDSECEGEIIRMSRCATITAPQTPAASTVFPIIVPQIPESAAPEPQQYAQISSEPTSTIQCTTTSTTVVEKPALNRIEVCMGGKCKKSGSLALLQEFENKVGTDGAVVGCKCLGKCGLGPNVRLRSEGSAEGSAQKNPLWIGVGLEDVGTIVADFFGDGHLGMN